MLSASYSHPYSTARELLEQDDKAAHAQREKELKEVSRLEKSAHQLRQIGINKFSDSSLKRSAQIAKRAEAIKAQTTEVYVEGKREVRLSNSGTHAKYMMQLQNVDVSAPDGKHLFHIEKLSIGQDERLILMGVNGAGKSQFIQMLRRAFADKDTAKQEGISIGPSIQLGYIDQQLSQLPLNKGIKDFIVGQGTLPPQRVIPTLVEAGFPYENQDKKIERLSYGERSRLSLLALRLTEPNFYIMDEPTNHIDVSGQEQLEREIMSHGASCVLVSHDRSFVANLGTRFCVIHDGKLREIDSPEIFYEHMLNGTPMFPSEKGKKKIAAPRVAPR
jgi:ATPase subunit of ABC transporter with duplicated ATPase domains